VTAPEGLRPAQLDRSVLPAALVKNPHRRYNPLLDEWVLVSAERLKRPWQGLPEELDPADVPAYEADCHLCPGNRRANGEQNPDYESTFVFTNDFAALQPDIPEDRIETGLLRAETGPGTCRVICFSRRHDLTLAGMEPEAVRQVIDLWARQTEELGATYQWVQIFENQGHAMGASNPHPHGQIWASGALPRDASKEDATQRAYWQATGRRLLLDYVDQELGSPRILAENEDWLIVVPFWAAWPYETLVLPRRPVSRLSELDGDSRDALARALIGLLGAYDGLAQARFPYSMGWHQAPFRAAETEAHWQLHAHFYPPLLDGSRRKFMVGYELLAETQRDLSPETAAEHLRAATSVDHK
jgi:UDPglucose--hexose-1-phosphate uridylyltransferase